MSLTSVNNKSFSSPASCDFRFPVGSNTSNLKGTYFLMIPVFFKTLRLKVKIFLWLSSCNLFQSSFISWRKKATSQGFDDGKAGTAAFSVLVSWSEAFSIGWVGSILGQKDKLTTTGGLCPWKPPTCSSWKQGSYFNKIPKVHFWHRDCLSLWQVSYFKLRNTVPPDSLNGCLFTSDQNTPVHIDTKAESKMQLRWTTTNRPEASLHFYHSGSLSFCYHIQLRNIS